MHVSLACFADSGVPRFHAIPADICGYQNTVPPTATISVPQTSLRPLEIEDTGQTGQQLIILILCHVTPQSYV